MHSFGCTRTMLLISSERSHRREKQQPVERNRTMIDQERAARAFKLTSPDFLDNGPLPERSAFDRAGCHGQNAAPTLTWDNVPAETRSFALLMNDIDAPVAGGFHHWVVYNI